MFLTYPSTCSFVQLYLVWNLGSSLLIKLLDLVLPMPSDDVPSLSILREFIGKSYFE